MYFTGWPAPKRLTYMECNWPYFVGFGLPLAVLTSLAPSTIIRFVQEKITASVMTGEGHSYFSGGDR